MVYYCCHLTVPIERFNVDELFSTDINKQEPNLCTMHVLYIAIIIAIFPR